jgi:hypothetical protein
MLAQSYGVQADEAPVKRTAERGFAAAAD